MPNVNFAAGDIMFLLEHDLGPGDASWDNGGYVKRQLLDHAIFDSRRTDPDVQQLYDAIHDVPTNRVITFTRRGGCRSGCLLLLALPFVPILVWLLSALGLGGLLARLLGKPKHFSILFVTLLDAANNPIDDNTLLARIQNLTAQIVPSRAPRSAALSYVPAHEANIREALPPIIVIRPGGGWTPRFELTAASPNWYGTGAPGQTVTGGPGAEPTPATGITVTPAMTATSQDAPWHMALTALTGQVSTVDQGAGVDVYILDTLPDGQQITQALNARGAGNSNPLLQGVRNRLEMVTDTTVTQSGAPLMAYLEAQIYDWNNAADPGVEIAGHPYDMSDHGLFVAGIIHSIAPQANLHVVQVLNKYGVGTTESFIHGLRRALDAPTTGPVIINCSLTFPIPNGPNQANTGNVGAWTREEIERMGWFTEWICDLLRQQKVLVVAAGGNERSGNGSNRPGARFPAAFDNVIGVAALGVDDAPASYASMADSSLAEGIATFGGDTDPGDTPMLGLYLGSFPDPDDPQTRLAPSSNGLGYWSGSSFATAVISGALALLRGKGHDDQRAQEILHQVSTTATAAEESKFLVHQG